MSAQKIRAYPVIMGPVRNGFSLSFPDLPGAVSGGDDYNDTLKMARECLSLHLYGMMADGDKIPPPSPVSAIRKKMQKDELLALVEPDVFSIKAKLEGKQKSVRVDITLPQNLLKAADRKAKSLGLNRSKFIQKALQDVL